MGNGWRFLAQMGFKWRGNELEVAQELGIEGQMVRDGQCHMRCYSKVEKMEWMRVVIWVH